jgi:hypothetical protein
LAWRGGLFFFLLHRLPLDFLFLAPGALSLQAGNPRQPVRLHGGGSRRIRHPHHLLGHAVGLLFVLIPRLADFQFGQEPAPHDLIADGVLKLAEMRDR